MNRKHSLLLIPILSLVFAWPAQAINLTFDFTTKDRMGVIGGLRVQFNELYGTEFLGQKISLDINFAGDQFIRIFSITARSLEISFNFPTNNYPIPWTGSWALADNINGYVTGKNGKQIKQATTKNSGGGFEGDIGIFPLPRPGNI